MTAHLGSDKHAPAGRGSGNSRNGTAGKRPLTEIGGIELDVPRDRIGSFAPQIVRKGQTRLDGFNDRIIALYARGMTTRDIRAHLREMYDVEVSPDLISRVTDGVVEELQPSAPTVSRWKVPPTQRSTVTESGRIVAWSPPQNAARCSGVVNTVQTSAGGASRYRVAISSSPSRVAFVVIVALGSPRGVLRVGPGATPTLAVAR